MDLAEFDGRRLVERAFEKIRQASCGMPAAKMRQLDALAQIMQHTTSSEQRELLITARGVGGSSGRLAMSVQEPA